MAGYQRNSSDGDTEKRQLETKAKEKPGRIFLSVTFWLWLRPRLADFCERTRLENMVHSKHSGEALASNLGVYEGYNWVFRFPRTEIQVIPGG